MYTTTALHRAGLRWALGAALLTGAALLPVTQAHAGRSCEAAKPPPAKSIERGMQLAERTSQALDATGAQVVMLGRAGQDLSKYGLRYSHLGWAYKSAESPWRVVHKLNHCGTAESALYRQGLGEFFLDDLWRYEAAWVVPVPAHQAALLAALEGPRATALHHKGYNMVSYVWGQRYQQSNQWAIEWMAAALEPGATQRSQAQAWLQFKGYQPTTLKLGPLTRLGGRIGSANIAFDDHPNEKRFSDRIETVTVDSVFDWMPRAGLGGPVQRLSGS